VSPYAAAAPSILFAGRLEPEKGLTDLLEALNLVKADWRLEVAGDGADRPRCEQTIRERGWSDRVRFHGWLDGAALARLYAGARLVAMPSTWPEPFGRVGLDALAYGRPVVAYNVGGISSWLEDGRSGYLVSLHDRSALASRIEALLDDAELAAGLGRYGARVALERFGAAGHIEALIENFESLLAQPA
jgi:glycosyltransferase involved in cell wall biosynthesis